MFENRTRPRLLQCLESLIRPRSVLILKLLSKMGSSGAGPVSLLDLLAKPGMTREEFRGTVAHLLLSIDELVNVALNRIIHSSRFQYLEASWRGLEHLVRSNPSEQIVIRFLQVCWEQFRDDMNQALDYEQSHLFQKINTQTFSMPGGVPIGVILADFRVTEQHGHSETRQAINALEVLGQIGESTFVPVLVDPHAVSQAMGIREEVKSNNSLSVRGALFLKGFVDWHALRASDASRFLGMIAPQTLMRCPYTSTGTSSNGVMFTETTHDPQGREYLWGSGVYAFGEILIRTFAQTGWFEEIVGVNPESDAGGYIKTLAVDSFETDDSGIALKFSTRTLVTDSMSVELAKDGIIAISPCQYTRLSAIYHAPTLHQPRFASSVEFRRSQELSIQFNHLLCLCRIAQVIKVMARNWIGLSITSREIQDRLNRWIVQFVSDDSGVSPQSHRRFPLRKAQVEVHDLPGKPGEFGCVLLIQPRVRGGRTSGVLKLVFPLKNSGAPGTLLTA